MGQRAIAPAAAPVSILQRPLQVLYTNSYLKTSPATSTVPPPLISHCSPASAVRAQALHLSQAPSFTRHRWTIPASSTLLNFDKTRLDPPCFFAEHGFKRLKPRRGVVSEPCSRRTGRLARLHAQRRFSVLFQSQRNHPWWCHRHGPRYTPRHVGSC